MRSPPPLPHHSCWSNFGNKERKQGIFEEVLGYGKDFPLQSWLNVVVGHPCRLRWGWCLCLVVELKAYSGAPGFGCCWDLEPWTVLQLPWKTADDPPPQSPHQSTWNPAAASCRWPWHRWGRGGGKGGSASSECSWKFGSWLSVQLCAPETGDLRRRWWRHSSVHLSSNRRTPWTGSFHDPPSSDNTYRLAYFSSDESAFLSICKNLLWKNCIHAFRRPNWPKSGLKSWALVRIQSSWIQMLLIRCFNHRILWNNAIWDGGVAPHHCLRLNWVTSRDLKEQMKINF